MKWNGMSKPDVWGKTENKDISICRLLKNLPRVLSAKTAGDILECFCSFLIGFPRNQFEDFISSCDNVHEMSTPVFWER